MIICKIQIQIQQTYTTRYLVTIHYNNLVTICLSVYSRLLSFRDLRMAIVFLKQLFSWDLIWSNLYHIISLVQRSRLRCHPYLHQKAFLNYLPDLHILDWLGNKPRNQLNISGNLTLHSHVFATLTIYGYKWFDIFQRLTVLFVDWEWWDESTLPGK